MGRNVNVLVLAAILFLICFPTGYSQSAVTATKLEIFAEKGWQDTGVQLKEGQYYEVHAKGSWVSGYKQDLDGPEGKGWGTLNSGALVGWIAGRKPETLGYESYKPQIIQSIILISRGGLFKSYGNGNLFLSMGEWSGCKECDGKMEVLITVYD